VLLKSEYSLCLPQSLFHRNETPNGSRTHLPSQPLRTLLLTSHSSILDACLTSTKAILASCAANDYGCLCDQYTNVLTCYNNCPDDPGRFGIQQEVTQNCAANKAYGTTSTIPKDTATKTTATSAAASTGTGTAVTTGFGTGSSSTGTSSGSASGSTHTGAAQRVVVSGGLVGLAGGVFGLLL
jgi:hypothetical protein